MLTVLPVEDAQRIVVDTVSEGANRESVSLKEAVKRVLAVDINSPADVPAFPRSTVDGFAVHAAETFGAQESMPSLLRLSGEVLMGEEPAAKLSPGEAVKISTGGMLPEEADAVVMLEYVDLLDEQEIAVYRPAAPGENLLRQGEDFSSGSLVLQAGALLRPQDLGVLAALGITSVEVFCRPRVGLISTGDELVPPEALPRGGQIRDVNSCALGAQVKECGGEARLYGIIPDQMEKLTETLKAALEDNHLVIISGGSSVGSRDLTFQVIEKLGPPGVLFHGVSMRPGKPMIFGKSGKKLLYGLSGNPVSAMFGFEIFIKPVLRRLQGLRPFPAFIPSINGYLSRNVPSASGREDYVRVMLDREGGRVRVDPVFGPAGLLFTMVHADGYICIPRHVEGRSRGDEVEVTLF